MRANMQDPKYTVNFVNCEKQVTKLVQVQEVKKYTPISWQETIKLHCKGKQKLLVLLCEHSTKLRHGYLKIFINYWHTLWSTNKSWMLSK